MRWMLTGYCGLVLIHMSVALNNTPQISQKPRFCGVRTRRSVCIYCLPSKQQAARAHWYKAKEYNDDLDKREEIQAGGRMATRIKGQTEGGCLCISDVAVGDRGVYFCRIDNTWGSGTELQVARPVSQVQALYRTTMKDGLIILQGLLLAVCVAATLLRKRKQLEKTDIIYEEPETNNIYEGLTIETCGGGLYEELSVYARPEEAEAPWE